MTEIMHAEVKRLHSPDVQDLAAYRPRDPNCFAFLLQVMVGPENIDGEESFDVLVCTPRWLEANYADTDCVLGTHKLLVFSYSYEGILAFVESHVRAVSGETWEEIAGKLSVFGHWEFADYQPAEGE